MRETKIYCDRCHNEIIDKGLELMYIHVEKRGAIDLCPSCYGHLYSWLNWDGEFEKSLGGYIDEARKTSSKETFKKMYRMEVLKDDD